MSPRDATRDERFLQPIEDIEIISRAPRPRIALSNDELEAAAERVADGEKVRDVATDVAQEKVAQWGDIPETEE